MDARLLITSLRVARSYRPAPLGDEAETRILDAGRLTGSARNRQPWRFYVVEGSARGPVAAAVFSPHHVAGAAFVVAIAIEPGGRLGDVDAGRAAQNMMLAAWNEGVGSCPNGVADHDALAAALGLEAQQRVPLVISFGVPDPRRDPAGRSPERWSAGARRLPLSQLVRRVGGSQ
ncbi:MAG: nitroreductase family protein [Thermoleophilia bacterium]|jgi:nitroreductase